MLAGALGWNLGRFGPFWRPNRPWRWRQGGSGARMLRWARPNRALFLTFFEFLVGIGPELALFDPFLPPTHADVMMRPRASFRLSHRPCSMRPAPQTAKMAVENGGGESAECGPPSPAAPRQGELRCVSPKIGKPKSVLCSPYSKLASWKQTEPSRCWRSAGRGLPHPGWPAGLGDRSERNERRKWRPSNLPNAY